MTEIAIVGGGIAGLSLALGLHQRGRRATVYESVPVVREVGVGITLLPHAVRELAALGLQTALERAAIENYESVFFNRFGQFIYRELRGRHAGYPLPELGLHRGRLHRILWDAVVERLGPNAVVTDHRALRVDQDDSRATVHFQRSDGGRVSVSADAVVACDGVNSALRRQFYPDETLAFAGINTWRGVSRFAPILTGKSYLRIGSIGTGKMVIYPISDERDEQGRQLINWVAEIQRADASMNDWNQGGRLEDVLPLFADWRFDWLDVPALIRAGDPILEYPMVDRDPVARWSFGRVTLMGDAAHPMYPRGSNGSAQAIIDACTLAGLLATAPPDGVVGALAAYERERLGPTSRVVETNRSVPPDYINIKVDELTGGRPFGHIDEVISQDELRRISDDYKRIAGFALPTTGATPPAHGPGLS